MVSHNFEAVYVKVNFPVLVLTFASGRLKLMLDANLALVVQRVDNFIQRISRYPANKIY